MQKNTINLTNVFVGALVSVFALGAMFSFATPAKAQSIESLQAQIAALMAQISALSGGSQTPAPAMSYDFGMVTLKQGSTGASVMALQNFLNAHAGAMLTVDGNFGSGTKAAVMAWQASKGLSADGAFGPASRAAAQAQLATVVVPAPVTPIPGTPSTGLQGGAGDLTTSQTSTDVESSVKEDSEENVLGMDLEADGSDIAVTSVKVEFQNNSGNGSTRLNKYVDEVVIMLAGEEVGSMDASDFSKDGSVYSKSIALTDAVVDEDEEEKLYVVVKTLATVDDTAADFDITATQIRYMDATGAIFSDTIAYTENFGFDDANVDDDLAIKSSSADPDATNLIVEENNASDDFMIGAFKLEVDEDSSDIALVTVPVVVTFTNYDVDDSGVVDGADDSVVAAGAEQVIDSLWIEIDGEEFEADLGAVAIVNGAGTATYSVDVDEDFVIEAGDTVEVKIYAIFNDQDTNYNSGVQVRVAVAGGNIDAEGEDTLNASGNFTGEDHTLLVSGAAVTYSTASFTAENIADTVDGTISLTFKVEAIEQDVVFADDGSDFTYTLTGATETDAIVTCSGLTASGGDFTVDEGAEKTCTLSLKFNTTTGFVRLEITDVAGTSTTNIITPAF